MKGGESLTVRHSPVVVLSAAAGIAGSGEQWVEEPSMYMLQKSLLDENGSISLIETVSLALLASAAADAFFVLGVRARRDQVGNACVSTRGRRILTHAP